MNIGRKVKSDVMTGGLSSYMTSVFNMMTVALVVTGIVAYLVASNLVLARFIYGNPAMSLLVSVSPLIFVLVFGFKMGNMRAESAMGYFYSFAILMGLSLGYVFLRYTGESIARVFFITAATFLSMSIYGYTTKKDLTSIGSSLIMGVFGLIIASFVNIFMRSSMLHFAVSILGVLIFTGLTAYDVQKIKYMYSSGIDQETSKKMAVWGALQLYMNFINMFLYLLRLFGNSRD